MNISTYEARIAALEAQLGPGPGPVPETGLVSVVVTPDITLDDGTSLNAKLAAMMPMAGGIKSMSGMPETPLEEGTEYSFVVTPASGDMAGYIVGIDKSLSSEKGAPLSGSVSVVDGTLTVKAFSYDGFEEDEGEQFPIETANVGFYIGNSDNQ